MFGDNNVIAGNFIGTDVTGTIAQRTLSETLVEGTGNRIGGTTGQDRNLFAAGQEGGLRVFGTANVIQGNFIGTDVTGTKALPNGRGFAFGSVAVRLSGANTFGGTAPGAGNLVSGNLGDAISITGADGSVVQGNLIGTDITGTKMLGNTGGGSGITAQADGLAPLLIGGADSAARNIISNNTFGIIIGGTGVVVQGNYIGTDITGTVDFGNLNDGVFMSGNSHLIGGTVPGAGNLISGNGRLGIALLNLGGSHVSSGNLIQGNRIGTQADGVRALGNGSDGIAVAADFNVNTSGTGPVGNLIGGTDSGAGNIIGFNGRNGVNILAGQRIGILSNSIFFNSGLGIDLSGDGATANDSGDPDNGDNNLQNFPVLSAAATDGSKTTVSGTLNSTPNTVFVIQVFASPADPSGIDEGQSLLGTHYVNTDASGNGAFTFVFPVAVPVGQRITATATDLLNNTSEFSLNLELPVGTIPANQPPVAHPGRPYTINEGDSLSFFSPSDDPDGDSITIGWDINGDGVFGDAGGAAPTLTWAQLQLLGVVNGPSSFDVRVRVDDGEGHLVTSSATTLNVLNVKPVANAGPTTRTVFEGSQIDFIGTFIDPGTADTHTLLWHVTASNGQVISDGSNANFSFVPFDNGAYTVTFMVTDSDQESGTAVINVNVLNANPFAQIIGLPAQGTVGVPIHLTSSISDPSSVDEAAGLFISWFADLTPEYEVEFTATTPEFTFTPTEPGIWDLALVVRDKDFGRGVFQVFLEVLPVDAGSTPSVTLGPEASVDEGTNYVSSGSFVDPDLDDTWTATVNYGDGAGVQPLTLKANKTFDLAHTYADNGEFELVVTVTDSSNRTGTRTKQVTVANAAPAAIAAANQTATAGTSQNFQLGSFSDLGINDANWTVDVDWGDGAAHTTFEDSAPGQLLTRPHIYTAGGTFSITLSVTDKDGASSVATFNVTVSGVDNHAPVFSSSATFDVPENSTVVGTVVATDTDLPAQSITYSITGGVDAGKFLISNNGGLTFASAPNFESPQDVGTNNIYNLQVTANDGQGGVTTQNLIVTVTGVNDNNPVFTSAATITIPENSMALGTLTATDADLPAQAISFSISGGLDAAQFVISNADVLAFVVAADFEQPVDANGNNIYELEVTASDGLGGLTVKNITVVVTNVSEGGPALHLDLGGASVTFTKKQPPVKVLPQIVVTGTATLEGGSLVLSMNVFGTKKKILDQILIPATSQLGSSIGPQVVNRRLTVEIQLNAAATNASIQSFLRGITFATKGKAMKTLTRNMQVTLTASAGESSAVTQTINVRKKPTR